MKEILYVNDLIEWVDESGSSFVERIIWIDEGYIIAFAIDVNIRTGFPILKKITDLQEAINKGSVLKIKTDPWARIIREEDLSQKEKEIRDKYWNIISPIVIQEPSIYYRDKRGAIIKQAVEQYNSGRSEGKLVEKTIYKLIRKYWQRGKDKNSLLPDYENSGGKGKLKVSGEKKRGRPRKYASDPIIGEGINITEDDKKIFRLAIAKYYHNSKQNFLTTAYDLTIKNYYSEEINYDEHGSKRHLLIPSDKRPTFVQFKYWYEIEHPDIRNKLISRKGYRRYALEDRAITGDSTSETIGPGSRYQIDATIADVFIVSTYNQDWIIGRPVIYVVIDVFSRMVVGIYVGLEGPSWIGAMMALSNAASDKVAFCKKYGIEITDEQWPCHHIPDAILGDRGELIGMSVETLIPNLNVRIENAAPYRADWKGVVEKYFGTIHGHVKPFVPGYIDKDYRKRGATDYRLNSTFNLEEFTEAIIYIILYQNNKHWLEKYPRDEKMIADDISPIPRELWKWGISNRSGKLRTFPEDIVKLNLMPTGNAIITEFGIKFKGIYYTCEKARQELWFEKARSNSSSKSERKLDVSYDIRNLDYIYIRSSDGRSFEKCFLKDKDQKYFNKTLYDIEYLLAYEKLVKQKNQSLEQQDKTDLIAKLEDIASKSKQRKKDIGNDNLSNKKRTDGIRENRSIEKATRRESEGFELEEVEIKNVAEIKDINESENDKLVQLPSLQPNHLDILRRKNKERKHGRDN
jgi:Integrase core domain/Mu transposase, C-terminal